jgi:hypothetical protein
MLEVIIITKTTTFFRAFHYESDSALLFGYAIQVDLAQSQLFKI